MNIEIREDFAIDIYGFSGVAANNDYTRIAFRLSDRMWHIVKEKGLKNKGINIWVYEQNEKVFAGVELEDAPKDELLERKSLRLAKYGYYKHIGPYNIIKDLGRKLQEELKTSGHIIIPPYVEIYGHWTSDETKLETELLMCIK